MINSHFSYPSRERKRSRSRSRDRRDRGDRDRGERRYQIKYRYWDIPPAGYEHMTPKEYKELQGFWAIWGFWKID